MDIGRFALTVLAATIGTALTDWFFFGVLFHDRYLAHPEVWRGQPGKPEGKRIALSTVMGAITCAAFTFVCVRLGLQAMPVALKLALAVWVIAPLPLIVTNALWMKLHPSIAVSHSLGWLAKLAVTALVVTLLRP
jgi:Protein of unknown function (DUF1761)